MKVKVTAVSDIQSKINTLDRVRKEYLTKLAELRNTYEPTIEKLLADIQKLTQKQV